MYSLKNPPATLLLEDGSLFHGYSFGVDGSTLGEVVFNTSMTGYQEMLSDCSYAGQILTLSYPHIGNTGINLEDNESHRIWAHGLIVRQYSEYYSNWRAEKSLSSFLMEQNVVAISQIDTRSLIHVLREKGSMMGCIISERLEKNSLNYQNSLLRLKEYILKKTMEMDFTKEVSLKSFQEWTLKERMNSSPTQQNLLNFKTPHIIIYDFGFKHNIPNCLRALGCQITIIPANTSVSEFLRILPVPSGIVLSNGPGNPNSLKDTITLVSELIETNLPILGICLGHQLLALASGARVTKMKFGHHGANHPVLNLKTGHVMITSQNHGYTVQEESLPPAFEMTYRSLFDGTLQGFQHTEKPIMGFQGHPEASPGPEESIEIFKDFLTIVMNENKKLPSEQQPFNFKQVIENA